MAALILRNRLFTGKTNAEKEEIKNVSTSVPKRYAQRRAHVFFSSAIAIINIKR